MTLKPNSEVSFCSGFTRSPLGHLRWPEGRGRAGASGHHQQELVPGFYRNNDEPFLLPDAGKSAGHDDTDSSLHSHVIPCATIPLES